MWLCIDISVQSDSMLPYYRIYEGVTKSFRTESITKYRLTFGITRWEATKRVMAARLTRPTHKIVIQLHLVAESRTICSSSSRQSVQKILDTPSYIMFSIQAVCLSVYIEHPSKPKICTSIEYSVQNSLCPFIYSIRISPKLISDWAQKFWRSMDPAVAPIEFASMYN